jgi:hypothetical protein
MEDASGRLKLKLIAYGNKVKSNREYIDKSVDRPADRKETPTAKLVASPFLRSYSSDERLAVISYVCPRRHDFCN